MKRAERSYIFWTDTFRQICPNFRELSGRELSAVGEFDDRLSILRRSVRLQKESGQAALLEEPSHAIHPAHLRERG